jgi:hypothetical protein
LIFCSLQPQWAQVFLQVAVAVLVFGLGIPTLVIQATIHDDVRKIVYRNHWMRWRYLLIAPFIFIVFTFVLAVYPCDLASIKIWNSILLFFGLPRDGDAIVAGIIMTFAIIGLASGILLQDTYRKDKVLNSLKKKCARRIAKAGTVDDYALEDIQYLGEHCETVKERELVLHALDHLAKKVQNQKLYRANGLGKIIEVIEFVLQSETDIRNFSFGMKIYETIINTINHRNLHPAADIGYIIRSLKRSGENPFCIKNDQSLHEIVDVLKLIHENDHGSYIGVANVLQEIGVYTLKQGRYQVAVEALNQLEVFLSDQETVYSNDTRDYLGLVSHFWFHGNNARFKAQTNLYRIIDSLALPEHLTAAHQYFYSQACFDTADLIERMRNDSGNALAHIPLISPPIIPPS